MNITRRYDSLFDENLAKQLGEGANLGLWKVTNISPQAIYDHIEVGKLYEVCFDVITGARGRKIGAYIDALDDIVSRYGREVVAAHFGIQGKTPVAESSEPEFDVVAQLRSLGFSFEGDDDDNDADFDGSYDDSDMPSSLRADDQTDSSLSEDELYERASEELAKITKDKMTAAYRYVSQMFGKFTQEQVIEYSALINSRQDLQDSIAFLSGIVAGIRPTASMADLAALFMLVLIECETTGKNIADEIRRMTEDWPKDGSTPPNYVSAMYYLHEHISAASDRIAQMASSVSRDSAEDQVKTAFLLSMMAAKAFAANYQALTKDTLFTATGDKYASEILDYMQMVMVDFS